MQDCGRETTFHVIIINHASMVNNDNLLYYISACAESLLSAYTVFNMEDRDEGESSAGLSSCIDLRRQLRSLKTELKGWEAMFERKHGHKPTKVCSINACITVAVYTWTCY